MGAPFGSDALQERKIRNWLLLLLCFAVTREAADRLAVLAAADELDASGAKGPAAPRFFNRTTKEVCEAILAPGTSTARTCCAGTPNESTMPG
jgi:hypothetical protein